MLLNCWDSAGAPTLPGLKMMLGAGAGAAWALAGRLALLAWFWAWAAAWRARLLAWLTAARAALRAALSCWLVVWAPPVRALTEFWPEMSELRSVATSVAVACFRGMTSWRVLDSPAVSRRAMS